MTPPRDGWPHDTWRVDVWTDEREEAEMGWLVVGLVAAVVLSVGVVGASLLVASARSEKAAERAWQELQGRHR